VERLQRAQVTYERDLRRTIVADAQAKARAKIQIEKQEARKKAERELRTLKDKLDKKEASLKRLRAHRAEERAQLEKTIRGEVSRAFTKREKALERTVMSLRDQNQELERRVEHLSAQDRGDLHEIDLHARLGQAFPNDEIRRRGKGGDILHTVCCPTNRGYEPAGLIVYECKDTLRWVNSFITQIKQDGQTHRTPYLILVTKAFPRKEQWLCIRDGVIVVHPAYAIFVAEIVRRLVIDAHKASLAAQDPDAKTARLYEYLGSEDFRQSFGAVVVAGDALTDMLRDEKRTHERVWTRREQTYSDLARKTAAIEENIRGIIEAESPASAKVVPLANRRSRRRRRQP
jgi:hypothetical protein